nr:hypothetical protein [Mycobacterium lepromatosis]
MNLESQRRYGLPTDNIAANAFTMSHSHKDAPPELTELATFHAQVDALGIDTALLVDTYYVTTGMANAVVAAGPDGGRDPHRFRHAGGADLSSAQT